MQEVIENHKKMEKEVLMDINLKPSLDKVVNDILVKM